jgi:multiple sugar transport system substrate-binding protein
LDGGAARRQGAVSRRQVVLLPAAAGAAGAVLAACSTQPGGEAPASLTAKPVTLSWIVWNSPTTIEAQNEGARLFKAKFPNVTFELPSWKAQQEIATAWLAGTGPHVAMVGGNGILIDSGRRGLVISLDNYIKRDARVIPLQDYVENLLNAQRLPEIGQFGLPMYVGTYVLFYNKKVFQERGVPFPDDTWDFDKYVQMMGRLTDPSRGIWGGLAIDRKFGMTKVAMNDGMVIDPKDDRKAAFASAAALEALQWTHDRLWRDRTWGQATEPSAGGFANAYRMLAAGKLATYEAGAQWALGDYVLADPQAVPDLEITVWPRWKQRASRISNDAWVVSKQTPEPDMAWEFMKFLQGTDWLDTQARIAGYQHPRISMQDRFVEVAKKGMPALAGKNLQAFTHPVKNRYLRPDAIFRKDVEAWAIITEAWTATMVKNEQPVSTAFADAARRVDAAMLSN